MTDGFSGAGVVRLLTAWCFSGNPSHGVGAIPRAIVDLERAMPLALAILAGSLDTPEREIPLMTLTETSFAPLLQATGRPARVESRMRTAVLCNDEAGVTSGRSRA
ncbi:MAG: hypothetical protein R2843_12880 [Thermomicrobiales bacterium]